MQINNSENNNKKINCICKIERTAFTLENNI